MDIYVYFFNHIFLTLTEHRHSLLSPTHLGNTMNTDAETIDDQQTGVWREAQLLYTKG